MLFNRKPVQAATETLQNAGASAVPPAVRREPVVHSRDKQVTEIPASLLRSHAHFKPAGPWSGVFDLAVWLRLPQGSTTPLQLALRYTDQRGENTVLVDICKPGPYKSALLNGSVELQISGNVSHMGLYLLSLPGNTPVALDEWHFLPQLKRQPKR